MKKQDILRQICVGRGITFQSTFISKGSTITRQALREIYQNINPTDTNLYLKHQTLQQICNFLKVSSQPNWFSPGSTVCRTSLIAVRDRMRFLGLIP